jgi:chromosomal replication initiator protein
MSTVHATPIRRVDDEPAMLDALWARLLATLEPKLPPSVFESWIRPCRLAAMDEEGLRIAAPNAFARDWLVRHHLDSLQAAAHDVVGSDLRVTVELEQPRRERRSEGAPSLPAPARDGDVASRCTFSAFVVGESNQFAQAACRAVTQRPAVAYNPLFVYGGVGLGKTHLLHAVGHEIARLFPSLRTLYLSSERFTNELINAIRYDRTAEFRARYRTLDLLLMDDIQFISGKERTQEEFFHTFNDLYEARKQIVISSDSAPKEIPDIEDRLRSRFEWGLIADIRPPDLETRVAILMRKAADECVDLPDEVAALIAKRVKSNIREIEGCLTRITAFCSLNGRELTVDLARDVLSEVWGEDDKSISIEEIQRKACEFFGVKLSDMRAKNRTKAVAFPRQIAMYLARQLTHASLAQLGHDFGGKDHTTVLHAVEKIQALIRDDAKVRKTVETLIERVTA